MKISRLLSILTILLNHDKVTAAELANRFEVSVRTIIRDMQTIGEAGIPIISYQGYEGGYGLVEGYKIDKQLLSNDEVSMTVSILKGLDSAIGTATIRNLIDKFEGLNHSDSEQIQVDLTPWGISETEKTKLTTINNAIKSCHLISIVYIDRDGKLTERIIEPLLLSLKMSVWYLYSYCRERKDYRLFKLSRIRSVEVLNTGFIRRPFDTNQIFSELSNQPVVHLELLFEKDANNRIYDYFDYDLIKIQNDGRMLVDVDYPEDEWVYSTLLSFGAQVTILQPHYIREIIKKRAEKIVQLYKEQFLNNERNY